MAVVEVEDPKVRDERTAASDAPAAALPRPLQGDRWTWEDLERIPRVEGLRFEVLDGQLVVNASPRRAHQRLLLSLAEQLRRRCPDGLEVLPGFDVRLLDGDAAEPDLLVVDPDQGDERAVVGPPALVVELLSPTTRLQDLGRKRQLYAALGVPSYWVVDVDEPWLLELRLTDDGTYAEARHDGPGPHRLTVPFAVDVDLRLP